MEREREEETEVSIVLDEEGFGESWAGLTGLCMLHYTYCTVYSILESGFEVFLCVCVCMSVCPSVCMSVCPSVYLRNTSSIRGYCGSQTDPSPHPLSHNQREFSSYLNLFRIRAYFFLTQKEHD